MHNQCAEELRRRFFGLCTDRVSRQAVQGQVVAALVKWSRQTASDVRLRQTASDCARLFQTV